MFCLQETIGYFFCLEDRALLCRKCDVAIHTANSFVSSHQRFLVTGVKVGLEATGPGTSSSKSKDNLDVIRKASECAISRSTSTAAMVPSTGEIKEATFLGQHGGVESTVVSNTTVPFRGGTISARSFATGWHLQEYLGLTNLDQNYSVLSRPSKVYILKIMLHSFTMQNYRASFFLYLVFPYPSL